ncbi:PREDICTED: olfactory receptor 5AC2-like [Nanorana parkeri]|uniref:olfactory receptor 5AC2-like n=1 Tax=Nanorana parkeri TaxID=125878 RepID=UPI0008550539|nr:PREDICTED: olfactory receptor 5AC2-like [Nanorana parkeri]
MLRLAGVAALFGRCLKKEAMSWVQEVEGVVGVVWVPGIGQKLFIILSITVRDVAILNGSCIHCHSLLPCMRRDEIMENVTTIGSHIFLMGLAELGNLRYLYSFTTLVTYLIVMVLCSVIVLVTWTEETLHEPMYIFISNLMLADMYGSTALMPKLIIDLVTGCMMISLTECLAQGFFLQSFPPVEILTFTAMAYDRYLAVAHPLMYPIWMTNKRAFKILVVIWIYVYVGICAIVLIASRQTLCGVQINSVFCETISLTHLSCGNTTLSIVFGFTWTMLMIIKLKKKRVLSEVVRKPAVTPGAPRLQARHCTSASTASNQLQSGGFTVAA